jgi:hypothetical protein
MKIELSPDLKLPLDAVTQTFAFLARRGAGKTYGASKLAEEFATAGAQVVVLDPVGVWWGLRLAANGKDKGIDIPVFGGEHGDIPLEPTGGALVARAIVEHGISVVLDVSHFRKGQRKQFCTDFAEELFHLKKKHRSPMHLFVEEAQVFVPQKTFHGDERMLGAFEDIIKLGRNYGIGATLISQRPQAVNKDVLNQTECLVVLQTNGKQERTALAAWMTEKDVDFSMLDELPKLEQGDAFVWSPSWLKTFKRIHIAKKWTFNASATPEVGKATAERHLGAIDLGALEAAMKETVARAKADDPKALRAELAQLRAEVAKGAKAMPAPAAKVDTKRVEVPVLKESEIRRLESAAGRMVEAAETLEGHADKLRAAADQVLGKMAVVVAPVPAPRQVAATPIPRRAPVIRPRPAGVGAAAVDVGGLSGPQQRILDALAWWEAFGQPDPVRVAVATIAECSSKSSAYLNNLGALRSRGLIDYPRDGRVTLTDAGRAGANQPNIPLTNEAMQAAALAAVTGPQAAILRVCISAYPNAHERQYIADAAGTSATSSAYLNNLGALRTLGFIDYPSSGQVAATDMLFPAAVMA